VSGSSYPPLTVDGHRAGATENLALAETLRRSSGLNTAPPVRWAVVMLFYAALHGASAHVLQRHNVRTENHRDRMQWFTRFPELRAHRLTYAWLERQAHAARYYLPAWTWADFDVAVTRVEPMLRALAALSA
jgi:hypothetical protein